MRRGLMEGIVGNHVGFPVDNWHVISIIYVSPRSFGALRRPHTVAGC